MGYSVSLVDGHIDEPKITDEDVIKALECCNLTSYVCSEECPFYKYRYDKVNNCGERKAKATIDLINRQKADISELQHKISDLEIELKSMRGAANSYKAKVEALTMDNEQLKSDLICEKMNFENVNELYKAEKEKLVRARQKLIDAFKKGEK